MWQRKKVYEIKICSETLVSCFHLNYFQTDYSDVFVKSSDLFQNFISFHFRSNDLFRNFIITLRAELESMVPILLSEVSNLHNLYSSGKLSGKIKPSFVISDCSI